MVLYTHTHTHTFNFEKKDSGCCGLSASRYAHGAQMGRSLSEMLGTLAIMGVLSIGAIAGFKYAMNRHRTNEILAEAQKRATLVVPQIQMMDNPIPTLNDFINNNLGYATFDTTVYTSSNLSEMPASQFGIKVSDVSKSICQNILNSVGDSTIIRRLSTESAPTTALTICDETNTFLMIYNNDMTSNDKEQVIACYTDPDCGECGTCDTNDGICYYPEQDSEHCSETTPYCNKGRCQECEPGKFQVDSGDCYGCDDPYVLHKASASQCSACPNRVIEGGQYCINCENAGNYYRAKSVAENTLSSCNQKGYIGYFSEISLGYAYKNCSRASNVSQSTVEYCAMCDASDVPRELDDGYCRPKKCEGNRFWSNSKGCYECDDYSTAVNASEEECHKCSNRLITIYETCELCSSTSFYAKYASVDECHRCLNRFLGTDEQCYFCDELSAVNSGECHRCQNRFVGTDGKCYHCDSTYSKEKSVTADSTECSRCRNRIYTGGKCILDCRSESEPFIDTNGTCYSCSSTEKSFLGDEESCATCSNRVYIDGKCVLDCRTAEEPLINSSGTCYPCDTSTSVLTTEAICDACSGRTYNEWGRCYIEKACTTTDSIRKKTGACAICSATGNLASTAQSECAKCKDLGTPRWSNATGATCYRCDNAASAVASTPAYCAMCDGTAYPRFLGTDEKCYSCDTTTSVEVENEAACTGKCGTKRTYVNGSCNKAS